MAKQWGGRFKKGLASEAKQYSYSMNVDGALLPYDLQVSLAHVKMLSRVKIIKSTEAKKITQGLEKIKKKYVGKGLCEHISKYEDVHEFVQAKLEETVGDVAKKLHTARSRNDLVATSTRLYLKSNLAQVLKALTLFQKALLSFAKKNSKVIIPGYTHLQQAQVVLMSHHVLAYIEMLDRDKARIEDTLKRIDVLPLGSGSLSGTTLPIDRNITKKLLGFSKTAENSMDAVSDRDFVIEVLSDLSILFTHLSRFSEDLILWNSKEFGYIELSDLYATGSSLMPQKKNPDMLELTRGKAGDVIGGLVSVLVMMKGLPLTYNRDMQEDKKPLFESVKNSQLALEVLTGLVKTTTVNKKVCQEAVKNDNLYATDVLDYLVKKGIAFSDAHTLVGKMVLKAEKKQIGLSELTLNEFQKFSSTIDKSIYKLFDAEQAIKNRKVAGSTGSAQVNKRLNYWTNQLRK